MYLELKSLENALKEKDRTIESLKEQKRLLEIENARLFHGSKQEESKECLCWNCRGLLIWQSDYSYEDYGIDTEETPEGIVACLVCSNCGSLTEVYTDIEE